MISVIVPTHNRAHLLPRAVQSVLAQTYQDFELILVDDTSTDNTCELIESMNDPRIRYIRHEVNRGGAAARNTATHGLDPLCALACSQVPASEELFLFVLTRYFPLLDGITFGMVTIENQYV